jgi:hypothetical protein
MRGATAFEMVVLYLALALVPYAVWRWRTQIETHLIVLYCVFSTTIFAAVVPNVGAVYRLRYAFVMTLAALGLAALLARVSAVAGCRPRMRAPGGRPRHAR